MNLGGPALGCAMVGIFNFGIFWIDSKTSRGPKEQLIPSTARFKEASFEKAAGKLGEGLWEELDI